MMIIKIILIKLDVIIIKRIWLKSYIKKCDGVPIVTNAPGAAARLDTPSCFLQNYIIDDNNLQKFENVS